MINTHFTTKDPSTAYAQNLYAMLEIKSMISGHLIQFKAFLNAFSQDFKANWNTETVYGRVDPIATFSNTTRTISLGWEIPAYNKDDAINNLNKCNALIGMMYPLYKESASVTGIGGTTGTTSFSKANSLSKPPLIKLKFANLISSNFAGDGKGSIDTTGLLGWADGVAWQPNLEAGMFVVSDEGGGSNFYPKVISITMNFNVLHQGIPTQASGFAFGGASQSKGTPNPKVSTAGSTSAGGNTSE